MIPKKRTHRSENWKTVNIFFEYSIYFSFFIYFYLVTDKKDEHREVKIEKL